MFDGKWEPTNPDAISKHALPKEPHNPPSYHWLLRQPPQQSPHLPHAQLTRPTPLSSTRPVQRWTGHIPTAAKSLHLPNHTAAKSLRRPNPTAGLLGLAPPPPAQPQPLNHLMALTTCLLLVHCLLTTRLLLPALLTLLGSSSISANLPLGHSTVAFVIRAIWVVWVVWMLQTVRMV